MAFEEQKSGEMFSKIVYSFPTKVKPKNGVFGVVTPCGSYKSHTV
jgi:hypothetical protein